ncbi:MAG: ATP-grasp domain-containing protein [Acidobacteria bacterium]|nr:ATP-grasp domain-containing protein [Acidobacteriota bacterium]
MKTILLIATTTGYQIRSFGEAAETLGVRLVFASDRCERLEDPWWDQAIPVRFHEPERATAAVVTAFKGTRPDGIMAVGDRPTLLAARLASAFGLDGNPPAAADASRNKLASRRALAAAGLPAPWFEPVSIDTDALALAGGVPYPAVIKPLALSGSRGVMRVDEPAQFVAAFERLRRLLRSPDVRVERDEAHQMAMIEAFIPGREFAVEGLLTRGALRVLAIFDKPDPLDGPFFEETIYVTPSRAPADVGRRMADAVAAAAAALGLWHGPIHAECRVHDDGVYVLEAAARPIGGLCSRALRFHSGRLQASARTGVSLEEVLLRHALGEDVSAYEREVRASGVMMIPIPQRGIYRRVEGAEQARLVAGIEDVQITAKEDALLVPLPEGKSYLGFIFARAESPEAVEGALREAHARLRFTIDREIPVTESLRPGA